MPVISKVLDSIPNELFVFNGSTFVNVCGSGAISGTPTADINVCVESLKSAMFNNSSQGGVPISTFVAGNEGRSFGFGGIFRMLGGPINLIATAAGEGLYFDGSAVHFDTIQGGTTYGTSYTLPDDGIYIVYGQHTTAENQLIVNGVVVDSVDIPLADQDSAFTNASPTFNIGGSADPDAKVLCDLVFVYNHAVDPSEIAAVHEANQLDSSLYNSALSLGGGSFELSSDSLPAEFKLELSGSGFNGCALNGCVVESNVLTPYYGTSGVVAGIMQTVLPVGREAGVPVNVSASQISWVGTGFTVETSIDGGTTYSPCSNNGPIPGVTSGVDMDNKDILVKVTFSAGGAYLSKYLESLKLMVSTTSSFTGQTGLSSGSVGAGAYLPPTTDVFGLGGTWASGGAITISEPDDSFAAVEMLVKFGDTSGLQTLFQVGDLVSPLYAGLLSGALDLAGISGGCINGVYSASPAITPYDGQVVHFVFMFTPKAGDIHLLTDHLAANVFNGSIKYFNIYTSLSQAQAESLYKQQRMKNILTVDDPTTIVFSHSAADVTMYNDEATLVIS